MKVHVEVQNFGGYSKKNSLPLLFSVPPCLRGEIRF